MRNDLSTVITVDAPSFVQASQSMRLSSVCRHRVSSHAIFAGYRVAEAGWQGAANPAIAGKNTRKQRPLGRCGPHGS